MRIKDWPVLIVISLPPSTLPRDFQSLIQSNPAHLSNFIVFSEYETRKKAVVSIGSRTTRDVLTRDEQRRFAIF